MQCETGCPKSLAGDDVKFVRDDEDGDEWNTAEKPDKSFKSSGKLVALITFVHRARAIWYLIFKLRLFSEHVGNNYKTRLNSEVNTPLTSMPSKNEPFICG